jgi:hypothetical protein
VRGTWGLRRGVRDSDRLRLESGHSGNPVFKEWLWRVHKGWPKTGQIGPGLGWAEHHDRPQSSSCATVTCCPSRTFTAGTRIHASPRRLGPRSSRGWRVRDSETKLAGSYVQVSRSHRQNSCGAAGEAKPRGVAPRRFVLRKRRRFSCAAVAGRKRTVAEAGTSCSPLLWPRQPGIRRAVASSGRAHASMRSASLPAPPQAST